MTAAVIPCVICDLPLHPIPFDWKQDHLSDIQLADPKFGTPGRIDLLCGIDVVQHYYSATRFVVSLPKKLDPKPLGKQRSQAFRRFLPLDQPLHPQGWFKEFSIIINESEAC